MERWCDETESGKTLKFRLISCFSIRKRVSCRLEVKAQTCLQRCQVRLILLICSALSLCSMFPVVLPGTVPNFITSSREYLYVGVRTTSSSVNCMSAFFSSPDVLSIHPSFDPVFHPSIQPLLRQEACTCCSSKWLGHHL